MKKLICILLAGLFAGCCSCNKESNIDNQKLQKAIKLADQIELNEYTLIATNGTLLIIRGK